MRKGLYILFFCLAASVAVSVTGLDARNVSRKKKKENTESVSDTVAKKTPYQKFLEKKGMVRKEGFVTICGVGNEIYLEIPDSVFGRKVVTSSRIEESSDPDICAGTEVSSNAVYVLDRTDSLVLFRKPASNIVVRDGDKSITEALGRREPVVFAFPIKYRSSDSTSVVIAAGSLFDFSDKKVVDLKGEQYGDKTVVGTSCKPELSTSGTVMSFGNSVGIMKEATFELSLAISGFGFMSSDKPVFSATILSTITLLQETGMPVRDADPRIGTRQVAYTEFTAGGGTRSGRWAVRWNLQPTDPEACFSGKGSDVKEPLRVYVDTLLCETWRKAVAEGIMAWEPAFEAAGLRNAIVVEPYPADSSFNYASPLNSCVSFAGGTGTSIGASILTDATTGRILSFRITVPGDYIAGVHRLAVYSIADVDPRYRSCRLPDDAVCEVLKAQVMRTFGLCLGLLPNMAGSNAYSPEQLRDPEFTSAKGITASVTDDVLFNYLAMPGDLERGVSTIVDKPGAYDMFAVEWLYRPFPEDKEKACLDSLLASAGKNPEYLYLPRQTKPADPRAMGTDLGNDVFAAYEAGLSHLKYVADNADKWLEDGTVSESYLSLFVDWMWLRFNNLTYMLSSYVGGVMSNDIRTGLPKMQALPESVQRKAVSVSLGNYLDVSWLEANKDLLLMSGAYRDLGQFTVFNSFLSSGISGRLPFVAMAEKEAGSSYSADEFLSDVQELVMEGVRQGRLGPGHDSLVARYLQWLISYSDVMKQNYKDAMSKGSASFAGDSFRVVIKDVPEKYMTDAGSLCFVRLQKARDILRQGISACRDSHDRRRLEFLLRIADAGLGNKKK